MIVRKAMEGINFLIGNQQTCCHLCHLAIEIMINTHQKHTNVIAHEKNIHLRI